MKRMSKGISGLLGLAAIVMVAGCTDARDLQIQELQGQLNDLRVEKEDLESRLAAALNGGDRANQLALSLQQQLDEARRQLAQGLAVQPEMPPGWTGTDRFAWVDVADDILFDSGKATLKEKGMEKVHELAATIESSWPDRQVWVIGHTDTDPIKVTKNLWSDNLDLSLNRAATVAREFYKLGLNPQHVVVAGQGEYRPKAPNDSKDNKALNRRVEIVAVEKQGD
jgi:flagellar motor protein MotB